MVLDINYMQIIVKIKETSTETGLIRWIINIVVKGMDS